MSRQTRAQLSDAEWALYRGGRCSFVTGSGRGTPRSRRVNLIQYDGNGGWRTFCCKPSKRGHPLGHCRQHAGGGR